MNWTRKPGAEKHVKTSVHLPNGESAVVYTHTREGVAVKNPQVLIALNTEGEEDAKALAEAVFAFVASRKNKEIK